MAAGEEKKTIDVKVTFRKESRTFSLPSTTPVRELKRSVEEAFGVPIEGQKLVGLKVPKGAEGDDTALSRTKIAKKVILMGSKVSEKLEVLAEDDPLLDALENDLEKGGEGGDEESGGKDMEIALGRVDDRVERVEVEMMDGFREGVQGTLVLDIDYTLFDHKSPGHHPLLLRRPYLLTFLTALYPHYNIVVWSATSLRWQIAKLRDIGALEREEGDEGVVGEGRKVKSWFACLVDKNAMVPLFSKKYGKNLMTKPLPFLWKKFPTHIVPAKTIMLDDCRRNFLLNRRHGLRIKPCKDLPLTRETDVELRDLKIYLLAIAPLPDFSSLKHRRWRAYVRTIAETPEAILREAGIDPAVISGARIVAGIEEEEEGGGGRGGGAGEGGGGDGEGEDG